MDEERRLYFNRLLLIDRQRVAKKSRTSFFVAPRYVWRSRGSWALLQALNEPVGGVDVQFSRYYWVLPQFHQTGRLCCVSLIHHRATLWIKFLFYSDLAPVLIIFSGHILVSTNWIETKMFCLTYNWWSLFSTQWQYMIFSITICSMAIRCPDSHFFTWCNSTSSTEIIRTRIHDGH